MILLVYVDDIVLTGDSIQLLNSLVAYLHRNFSLKDLGNLSYFLGIEASRCGNDMYLTQSKYIHDLLVRTKMSGAKPSSTPIPAGKQLSLGDGDPLEDPSLYRSVVGALQYLNLTRLDITFAVNKACQFMHQPTTMHWQGVKRILRYFKGTMTYGLRLTGSSLSALTAYSDADWASNPDDRRSTSGYAIFFGPNLISWQAHKQKVTARSSTESEYRAIASIVAELTWLKTLLTDIGVVQKSPPTVWCDNLGAIFLSANPVLHSRMKHVEIDFHFIREKVLAGELLVRHLSTHYQIADIFTKGLGTLRFQLLRNKLTVIHDPFRLRGCVKSSSTSDNSEAVKAVEENQGKPDSASAKNKG